MKNLLHFFAMKTFLIIGLLIISTFGYSQSGRDLLSLRDNPLLYNPAFAGNYGLLDASISSNRLTNITSLENNFSALSVSSPLGKGNWSIGGNLTHEKFGMTYSLTSLDGMASYQKNLKNGKLSIGGLVGTDRHRLDTRGVISQNTQPINDVVFSPQVGLGIAYQAKLWYVSISSPNMLNIPWTFTDINGTEYQGYTENDLYISGGLNLAMFDNKLQILPSATLYHINNTELQGIVNDNLTIGTSIVLFERFWLSADYEFLLGTSTDLLYTMTNVGIGVSLKNGLRIGGKLEWSVSDLTNAYYGGTKAGISLGYRFLNKNGGASLRRRRHFF